MKKRKVQIMVISALVLFILGGAFLNHKYAQVATSKIKDTEVATSQSENAKTEKKKSMPSEKKAENHAAPSKKADSETHIADQDADETTHTEQEKAKEAAKNKASEQAPAADQKEAPAPVTPVQPNTENKPAPVPQKEVTFSIKGTAANSSAYFISPQKVGIKEGQSVMDVLSTYCQDNGIQVGIRGGTYVAGINNLYEFDKGAESGWLYRVNGVFPNFGAAQYIVQAGDVIEWMYTENMGKDVGAPQV